jgi:putative ABC transport system ATP-binding protein
MAVARPLANDLDILLVDESTGNLDSRSGKDLLEFFEGLNRQGKAILAWEAAHFRKPSAQR